jgi:hypothetical protein
MALKYWVGGTNTWNGILGTKWALTSGGAGGQAIPLIGDDVFFDAKPAPNWIALTVTTLTTIRCPLVGTGNGYYYECTTAGTTGATEPTWPIIVGTTVVDGSVTWTCRLAVVTLTVGNSKDLNFTGYIGTFTFSGNLSVAGAMTLGVNTTYLTSGAVTTYTLSTSGSAMTLVSNGKILPVNFSTNGNVTINGNADFQGNFVSTSIPHTIKSAALVPCDLRIGGNINMAALTTNNTTDHVTFKAYGTSKTFTCIANSFNARVTFVSGSSYTNTGSAGISGTSFFTVESGGRFNALNNINSFSANGTLTLSGFNSTTSVIGSDFMSIATNATYVLLNDTVIKGFINISAICTISTSTGAKILLEGNLLLVLNSTVTIDNLEFSGTALSTISGTATPILQIKNLSFNKTGAGSVNITATSFTLTIPAAAPYTWTHTSGAITQSTTSRIAIACANTASQLTYSESIALSTPFTFSQLVFNNGILSLNSTLRATRLFLTLAGTTSITSSGLIGFDVDILSVVNSVNAIRTLTLKSGCTYAINTQLVMLSTNGSSGQITLNASVVSGTRAYFNLDYNATQLVDYVTATDIDSSGTLGVPTFTKQLIYTLSGVLTRTIHWSVGAQPPPVLPSRTVAYTFVN